MNAILLAAGVGSRISKDISQQHKCLLPLPIKTDKAGQTPLLVYTIHTLQSLGVQDISIVTGYMYGEIVRALTDSRKLKENSAPKTSPAPTIFYNPFYYLVNSIGSLWFAKDKITDTDLLILNADTFLEHSIYIDLLQAGTKVTHPLLLVDSSRKDKADVKVTYSNNVLVEYGKEITASPMAESTDIIFIPKVHTAQFKHQLIEMIEQRQHDTWWESALVDYKYTLPIQVQDIAGKFWSEIDYYEDYLRICDFVKNN